MRFSLRHRRLLEMVCVLALATVLGAPLAAQAAGKHRVLIMGDSISAEYGLPRGTGWVALLQQRLAGVCPRCEVVNASISGETTAGGRARLSAQLARVQPRVVVIELGANDALRGWKLDVTRDNLTQMTREAQRSGARVLLLGMQLPPNYGADYTARFAAVYAGVARQEKAALVPFFFKPITAPDDAARFFQRDGIHPNEAAQPLLLDSAWPELKKLLP